MVAFGGRGPLRALADLGPERQWPRYPVGASVDQPAACAPAHAETPQPVPADGIRWLVRAADPDPDALAAEWAAYPTCPQRLRTGVTFSVVDAPLRLGLDTVAKTRQHAITWGPVAVEGDRLLFLVRTEALDDTTALLPARDENDTELGLRLRGVGQKIVAGPIQPQTSQAVHHLKQQPRRSAALPAGEIAERTLRSGCHHETPRSPRPVRKEHRA